MNTPKIRFKGFTDDWEQRKLSELTTMHARIGWQNLRTSEFLDSGDYMLITGTDFQDGVIDYSTCHYVEKERYDQDKNIQIQNGSILITKDGTLGKVAYVQGLMMPTTLNAGVFNVTIKNENIMDGKYLFQYLKAPFLMDYVSKKATGGTIKHLNQSILVDFPVEMPKTEEQVKISRYFTALDHLITLHQRKCDETKQLKKFMLQKMFPKNGEKNPEIRFEGFTDDWEQRKFKELCDMVTVGIANSATHAYSDSGVVMFRNQNIKPNFLDDTDIIHINSEFEVKYKNKRLKKNDLLVARTGYPGTACVVPEKYENSQTFTTLIARPNENVDPYFLCQYLNSDIGIKYFESTQIGGGQKNSGAGILNEMPVTLPSTIEEEKKIGDYFRTLDHLITLHQRKCEKLKELKKFMLQNMFV